MTGPLLACLRALAKQQLNKTLMGTGSRVPLLLPCDCVS